MKYLVISDIHGSSYYANKINEIYKKESPDKIILLGDLYYHGPRNPLTKEYNPMEVSKIFNSLKDKILCIKGNCDAEVDEMISEFKFNESITLEINRLKFFFTHGHKYNIENIFKDKQAVKKNKNIELIIKKDKKETFINKILNFIRNIFKKSN